jgi:molybdopterin converting factor small subunit
MIDILFFGRVSDLLGKRQMTIALPPDGLTLFDLRQMVIPQPDARLRMSINQTVVTTDQALISGDEVAFFSVFSGG